MRRQKYERKIIRINRQKRSNGRSLEKFSSYLQRFIENILQVVGQCPLLTGQITMYIKIMLALVEANNQY